MFDIDKLSPTDATILPVRMQWQLVHYWRDTEQFDRAEALIDANHQRGGLSITELTERSHLAASRGQTATAVMFARKRHAMSATASSFADLIRAELSDGKIDEASRLLDQMRGMAASGTIDQLTAEIALARGDYGRATEHYARMLRTDSPPPSAYVGLARVAIARGDLGAAREVLEILHEGASPLDLRRARHLASLWEQVGDSARAAVYRDRATLLKQELKRAMTSVVESRLRAMPALESSPLDDSDRPVEPIAADDNPPVREEVLRALQTVFGFRQLRPGQAAVVEQVMAGRDTLAIMPTGSGKSLTFQLPAMLLSGVTLVISPLIALMKDQVDSLPEGLRSSTRLINSTLSREEMQRALADLTSGALRLVYVAPERLRDRSLLQALKRTAVARIVIDEAHCISLWGQDFRPDYLFIPRALKEMGDPPVLAVTATATPEMARQIGQALGRDLAVKRVSLFRPNLFYEVRDAGNRENKVREMIEICRRESGSGIVYVNSRKDTETFAALLRESGVQAIHYHAGLEPGVRAASQDRFMSGQVRVVVATIAFGMGVDKANVRFIVHFNPPTSLEAYAQESGRAGRDGQAARCILLATNADATRLRTFSRQDVLSRDDLRAVYGDLKRRSVGRWVFLDHFDADRLGSDGENEMNSRVALGLLEQARLIARHPDMPRTITVTRTHSAGQEERDDDRWARIYTFMGFSTGARQATIDLIEATRALGMSPFDIDETLASRSDLRLRDGPRLTCIELLDAGTDAGERVGKLLAGVDEQAERRILQVVAYTKKRECRHRMLAAQFGEKLAVCRRSCDVCAGAAPMPRAAESMQETQLPTGPDAAIAVLDAVRTLPFAVGRAGLVKLLIGSAESRIRADRSPSFGALSGTKKGTVERLVDRLIELGYLFRDTGHEFLLISLTDKGRKADRNELARHFLGDRGSAVARSSADDRLLGRLRAWRTDRARQDGVPAYVVAHNTTLASIAALGPRSMDELLNVPGCGPAMVAKYGAEILRIVASRDESSVS